ncbi:MAG: choice-of-anchor J domain-containing protein [Bacteroidales bacterium]|nr:choice-of-anchor J domain-containing protein [Bacteroidales bacterium]
MRTLTLSSIVLAAMCCMGLHAQNTYFVEHFTDGIPSSFALYDMDGNEPSVDMANLGFAVGVPWICVTEGEDNNAVAASTSWYKKAGTSNDWMVTTPFEVKDAKAVLTWRARATDADYRDGYKVFVSTTGNTVDDFGNEPVFSVSKENVAWTEREVSLADYVGKTLWVAFVNTTKDRSMLYVDDIFAGEPACFELNSELEDGVLTRYGDVNITGSLTAKKAISSFTITLTLGEQTVTETFERNLKEGNVAEFALSEPIHIDRNTRADYTLVAEAEGDRVSLSGKASFIAQTVVAEEVTGTWCGYCVRGIVAMEKMREEHPDDYIGIAVHCGSNNWPDAMELDPTIYNDLLFSNLGMTGYPHCTVNRQKKYTGDPANIPYFYNQVKNDTKPKAGIVLSAEYDAKIDQIVTHTSTLFTYAETGADYRQLYVMIENNVHGEGYGYYQSNYYSGVPGMGQFTDLGSTVPDSLMTYPDVARAIYGTFYGIEGIYATSFPAGTVVDYDYTLDSIPASILLRENCELAVLLLNKNGVIVNADKVKLGELNGFSGIEEVHADAQPDKAEAQLLFTLDGKCLGSASLVGQLCQGIYLKVETGADGVRRTRKIIVR